LALAKNPLVVAPLLGALWAWGGVPLPTPAADLLNILGAATTPCALVSLGLFLAHKQEERTPGVMPLVAMKLILQPLLAWYLAFELLELPTLCAPTAVLLAALPPGTGPYMLAESFRRRGPTASAGLLP